MTKAQQKQAERDEAIQHLRSVLKPGDTVYTVLRHCSRSGMSRSISACIGEGSEITDITYWAATAMGDRLDAKNGGVKMGGCGMDMGFALVYNLSSVVFKDGYGCVGWDDRSRCPSNDHSNGDRDYTPHTEDQPHWHKEGGYALNHRWL